jgi:hypothetical protein
LGFAAVRGRAAEQRHKPMCAQAAFNDLSRKGASHMSGNRRVLRIRVTENDEPKVTIQVPLGLARLARIGGIADQVRQRHGIDLEEIIRGIEESPDGMIVDVIDEKTGNHVEICLETLGAAGAETNGAPASEAQG